MGRCEHNLLIGPRKDTACMKYTNSKIDEKFICGDHKRFYKHDEVSSKVNKVDLNQNMFDEKFNDVNGKIDKLFNILEKMNAKKQDEVIKTDDVKEPTVYKYIPKNKRQYNLDF